MEKTPTAAIVLIGDEILSGKVADENAAFLISELRALGVALRAVHVIPDVVEEIAQVVRGCSDRYDHVFTSGGVGPTHDDLTMEGIARGFGVKVIQQPELEKLMRAYYGERLVERNLRMAEVPDGAHLVYGNEPSWPTVAFKNVYIFPGVPIILRKKFAAMREQFRAAPYHLRCLYLLAEEGDIAHYLDAVVARFPELAVGSYPRFDVTDYKVKITLESKNSNVVEEAFTELAARLAKEVVRTE
jgi:molybdenum cofactor synthesis domain-containing protein